MSESGGPTSEIFTEFEEHDGPLDGGVEREITAAEEFHRHGERVERETKLKILEDGGVHLSQSVQGCFDSMTLNEDVVARLIREVEDR